MDDDEMQRISDADVDRLRELYDSASRGECDVPSYVVSTDPADNGFVVVIPENSTKEERTVIAGDVRRRFLSGAEDPFEGLRVPWAERR